MNPTHFDWNDLFTLINGVISVLTVMVSAVIAFGVVKTTQARLTKEMEEVARKLDATSKEMRDMCEGYREKCHSRLCDKLEKLDGIIAEIKKNIDDKWAKLAIEVGILVRTIKETSFNNKSGT